MRVEDEGRGNNARGLGLIYNHSVREGVYLLLAKQGNLEDI